MRQYSLFIIIFMLMTTTFFLNVACNDLKSESVNNGQGTNGNTPPPPVPPQITPVNNGQGTNGNTPPPPVPPLTPEQIAERKRIAEQVKKAFEENYRIEKSAEGYRLGATKFNDATTNATIVENDWLFIINQKEKRTIIITAPGVGTAPFKFDNFGNLTAVVE